MTALSQNLDKRLPPYSLEERILTWNLGAAHSSLSWALVGSGYTPCVKQAVWLQVENSDLPPDLDPLEYIDSRLPSREASLVFLTSADLQGFRYARLAQKELLAEAIVTVGLGNALRAGDCMNTPAYIGTINLACVIDIAMTEGAMLEALCIMTEAKTAALYDAGIRSRASGLPATGTGTDCQAILAAQQGVPALYAGKHTSLGSAVGGVCYSAVSQAITAWKEAQCSRVH